MRQITRYAALILIGVAAIFSSGCAKKTETKSPQLTEAKLPGTSEVMAALAKKDYDGAMAALLKARQSVTTDEQQVEFVVLSRQVKETLLEAAPTDNKAAEALTALRQMTMGR
jgi:hypothetical protein